MAQSLLLIKGSWVLFSKNANFSGCCVGLGPRAKYTLENTMKSCLKKLSQLSENHHL